MDMPRFTLRRTLAAIILFLGLPIAAEAAQPFDQVAFQAAQEAGKDILVDVAASWCPVCAKQKPIIAAIESERPDLVVFDIDFDSRKDLLAQFRVVRQSTLILFHGGNEIARATGQTDPDAILALVSGQPVLP